ncbi:2'-5' RNA ligase family protein [Aquincola sp. S2]|uniref:2'-5' RNA ligase family protein n=1 Tax=Pseudaquabacterium terrae TaxID=2732868 RepID=A0ABX2EU18_9BURK|nr:2'-5' RNA ligase family protein [Aquabacterium terrae]NRF72138.1 2'-5' RNA ligase family protein [Aquabacterium terrae]
MSTLYTLAYPTLSDEDRHFVERLRHRHDPRFFDRVAAHFTLVFGCSGIGADVYIEHVRGVAASMAPVRFACRYAMLGAGDHDATAYVYLVPDEGFSGLALLHDALYRGPLEPHLRLDVPFVPHITVCTTPWRAEAKALCDELNAGGLVMAGAVEALSVCTLEGERVKTLAEFRL